MNTKPDVTDEEIRSFMNFDAILERHREATRRTSRRNFKTGMVAFSILIIASVIGWFTLRNQNEIIKPVERGPSAEGTKALENVAVNVDSVDDSASTPSQKQPEQKQSLKKPGIAKRGEPKSEDLKVSGPIVDKAPAAVFAQAEPVAGYPDLYEYFSRELTYPLSRMKDSVSGVVTVVFTISKLGIPEKIEIEQSLGKEFDEEAIRVIQNMPAWKPATYNDKPMPSRISLPLTFQVKKIK